MGNKWNLMDNTGIYEKCCQMEQIVRNLFKSPNAWANGLIRLVSSEGTWYYNRETDIFVPVTQNYLEEVYEANKKPEGGSIRVKSRDIQWGYMEEAEALKILPGLAELDLPGTAGRPGLSEVCQSRLILLKDGKVYDGAAKKVHQLQEGEKGTVLQACRIEDKYKRRSSESWYYDIYLWAKAGTIPVVLSAVKPCWNTMQFLVDSFNNIDFSDFVLLGGESGKATDDKKEGPAKAEESKSPSKVEASVKEAASPKVEAPVKDVSSPKAEAPAKEAPSPKAEAPVKETSSPKVEALAKEAPSSKAAVPAKEASSPKEEASAKEALSSKVETPAKKATLPKEEAPAKEALSAKVETPAKEAPSPKVEALAKEAPSEKSASPRKTEMPEKEAPAAKPGLSGKEISPDKAGMPVKREIPAASGSDAGSGHIGKQDSFARRTPLNGQESRRTEERAGRLGRTEKMDFVHGEEEMNASADRIQELLDCDKNRCRLEPYDKDILYDIIRGHWELFEGKEQTEPMAEEAGEAEGQGQLWKSGGRELIARDPKLDIRQGVIGIDFGTKSTVVVRQDATNRIIPIRIGTGNLSNEVKEEDFENPSIIEFTNVEKFLEDYRREAGRPHTSCNDIFVSYDAYEDFRNCKPDDFYAYFNELKQWANREKGNVVIKDKQRKEYLLSENMEDMDESVNPIELYAYYIGLYINNMRNGIYLKYLMSFPVGYAKEVRDFIAKSFYDGIKKSLPSSILNDEECMEQFKVELGISEPAAYAVTALEQSGLEPKDETERLMYGIFDFGGGSTDFDFGVCRGATEEEYEKEAYDYVLECFGADSDVTLGGENILELMAYRVYQKNLDIFREKKITFTLPQGENGFAGSETLLINSQIARRNMSILKEELRPLWYQEQGWRKKYQLDTDSQSEADKEGIVVSLYDMDGEPVPHCILEFSVQDLVDMLKGRIQKGIDSFFQCLINIFLNKEKGNKEEDTIYIFLAGNSSKSIFVKDLFQRKIDEYYGKANKLAEELEKVHFKLIDPLTGESENGSRYTPNAKTGVAYGLLKSREGSSIKIVKNYETDSLQQSRFRYYLGRDRRHHFDCKFSPKEITYKKWVAFQGATKGVVRIYYTNNPLADSKMEQMPIENVPYKEINISVKEDAYLFIRTMEPDMIEYTVAKKVEEIEDNEIKKCYFN